VTVSAVELLSPGFSFARSLIGGQSNIARRCSRFVAAFFNGRLSRGVSGAREGEVLDSITGVRLAAAVDQRSGGLSIKNADVWQWGDAENAMNFWAQRTADPLTIVASPWCRNARACTVGPPVPRDTPGHRSVDLA
jgi:hypothetical protein